MFDSLRFVPACVSRRIRSEPNVGNQVETWNPISLLLLAGWLAGRETCKSSRRKKRKTGLKEPLENLVCWTKYRRALCFLLAAVTGLHSYIRSLIVSFVCDSPIRTCVLRRFFFPTSKRRVASRCVGRLHATDELPLMLELLHVRGVV